MSHQQTLEQQRAAKAWKYVQAVEKDKNNQLRKEYRTTVMKLPSLILTNGLGQTLAFLKSKGKGVVSNPEEKVYSDLQEWLHSGETINWGNANHDELIERIMAIDSDKYRLVTSEALSFLSWLKRFADAVLPKDGGE